MVEWRPAEERRPRIDRRELKRFAKMRQGTRVYAFLLDYLPTGIHKRTHEFALHALGVSAEANRYIRRLIAAEGHAFRRDELDR